VTILDTTTWSGPFWADNKYCRWYLAIITNAFNRPPLPKGQSELHHIIPKCFLRKGEERGHVWNVVRLTPKEHIICHHLLVKAVMGKQRRAKMAQAWHKMVTSGRHRVTPQQYEVARQLNGDNVSTLWRDPEHRAVRCAAQREAMKRPEEKARKSAAMREVQRRPEVKARQSDGMSELWKDPEHRARRCAAVREAWSDLELRMRKSAAMRELWKDPEHRAGRCAALREAASRPDVKERHREAVREAQNRPDVRARKSEALRKTLSTPEARKRNSEAQNRPEVKAKKSAAASAANYEAWNNPEIRARRIEGRREARLRREQAAQLLPVSTKLPWSTPILIEVI
jgi:hypothetical protein